MALVVKNLPANTGDVRHMGLIPGLGRSPGEGNGNALQYSCLENPMDRGAWQGTVTGSHSQTQLKQLSMHTKLYKVIQLIVIKLRFKSRPDTKPYIPLKNTKSYFLLVYSSCLKKH